MAQTQTQAGELLGICCKNDLAAVAVTKTIFLADRAYNVIGGTAIWDAVSTLAGSCTVDLFQDTGTTAMGGGTSILTQSTAFHLTQSARTISTFSIVASTSLAAGDRISAVLTGSAGTLSNLTINLQLQPK